MLMRTYLSIDLDYWHECRKAISFLSKVAQLDVPMIIVSHHDMLVDHINKSGCRHLINVDYHDDIVGYNKDGTLISLEEGSWVSHVRWAGSGVYEWRHPHHSHISRLINGVCDDLLETNTHNNHPWKEVIIKRGLDAIPLEQVRLVGFCVSVDWWRGKTAELSRLLLWMGIEPDVIGRLLDGYSAFMNRTDPRKADLFQYLAERNAARASKRMEDRILQALQSEVA
jgi:hypothetical protein